jgi:hypothetical protein
MKRAVWIISALLTVIISMAYFYFRSSLTINGNKDVFSYISSKNAIVACIKYEQDLKDIFEDDQNIPSLLFSEFISESVLFEKIVARNEGLLKSINGQDVYIACQKLNSKKTACLFITSLNDYSIDEVSTLFNANDEVSVHAKARKFESEDIYHFVDAEHDFYYVNSGSYLLLSKHVSLVEDALTAKRKSNSLAQHAVFKKWQTEQQSSKSLLSIYVNHQALTEFYSVYFQLPFVKSLSFSEDFADFSFSELNYKSDAWIFNGEMEASEKKYFHLLKSQTENRSYLTNYLSNSTWAFQDLILSDGKLFREELQTQNLLNQDYFYNAEQKLLDKKYFVNIAALINEHIGNEFIAAYQSNYSFLDHTGYIGMMVLTQSNEFEQELIKIVKTPKKEEYKGQLIKAFPFRKFMYLAAGLPYKELESNFYTIIEDRLILASKSSEIKKYIDDFQSDQILKNNTNFQNYISTLNDQYNYLFYAGIMGYESSFSPLLTEKGNFKLNDRLGWSNYAAFSFQVTSSDAGLISSIYMPMKGDDAETLISQKWQLSLESSISSSPHWITLLNKNEHYIIVQDDSNQLYLIDEESTLKWKKMIDQKIVSEVFVVDYYNNGESQLLFNTANYIYLLDLNGNSMPNYPIKLASTNNLGMSLFDYEKNRNYRIFIPCLNQNVYAYDISGRPVEGWNPKKVGNVLDNVKHINVKGKDLLFIANDQGYFYFFNRKGELQAQFRDSIGVEYNNPFYFDSNAEFAKNRFISTDQKGKIKSIFVDGKRLYKTVGNWTEKHFFTYANVMGDEKSDYIFIDNNQLMVYQDDTTLGFNYQFNSAIENPPFLFKINETESLVGIFSNETQQIYLFDRQGKLQNGFPLKASAAPAVLTDKGQKKMILCTKEGKLIYYIL